MKCCAIRINTILNFVYFNVLGKVEDLKKDTESIRDGVNDIKGDLKEGVEDLKKDTESIKDGVNDIKVDLKEGIEIIKGEVKDLQKHMKQNEENMKSIKERMEMFIPVNEYNAGKGKQNIVKRKLSKHSVPAIDELYIAGFCFILIVLMNPDWQKKFKESI